VTIARFFALPLLTVSLALSASRPAVAGSMTYLALGDSLAFGETDFSHNPSFGDRGYVGPYASLLGDQSHGARPNVVNLALDGETSSSFFNGQGRIVSPSQGGASTTQLNLNYGDSSTTQNALLQSTIATQRAAGNTIDTVSVHLGANDLFAVLANPSFAGLTPDKQQIQVLQAINAFQANETKLLAQVRGLLPNADLILPGYYNPYAFDPKSPMATLAGTAIQALNQAIAGEAAAFKGHYVDLYTPFVGHEAEYTYITQGGNVHPNDLGYGAIVGQIQTVPEPGAVAVLAIGLVGLALARRTHRRSVAA